ncbi:MAG: hypothetical protein MJ078_00295 [Clostridia bacterium]|nr:hypothetical protein [Clostridia bacterium]
MTLGFLGGDSRTLAAADVFRAKGEAVYGYLPGLSAREKEKSGMIFTCPRYLCETADAVILPMPVTKDGKTLFSTDLSLSDLPFRPGQKILGGMIPPGFYPDRDVKDYSLDEAFLRYNAFLTAQGALSFLLPYTKRGLLGISVGVVGFGRIASALCPMLHCAGASVTVYVRRESSRAGAEIRGFHARLTETATAFPEEILINTAPESGKKALDRTGLPGIPGTFAPIAAGKILADTLASFLALD